MVPSERQGTSRWLRAGGDGRGGVREEGRRRASSDMLAYSACQAASCSSISIAPEGLLHLPPTRAEDLLRSWVMSIFMAQMLTQSLLNGRSTSYQDGFTHNPYVQHQRVKMIC